MKRKTNLKPEVAQDILDKYNSGMSTAQIGKLHNLNYQCILKFLKNNNINIRSGGTYNKYKANENYFENLDHQNKAYFLGFLFADGYIQKNGFRVKMTLQEDDKEILEKLNKLIYEDRPLIFVSRSDCKDQFYLTITNKKLCLDLRKLGLISNKTYHAEFPDISCPFMIQHFIRGLFDGDGTLNVNKPHVSIVGTKKMCYSLQKIVFELIGVKSSVYIIKNSSVVMRWSISGRNNISKFLSWMYKDAELFMQRKFDKYQIFLQWKKKEKQSKKIFTQNELFKRQKIQKIKSVIRKKINNSSFVRLPVSAYHFLTLNQKLVKLPFQI